MSEVQLGAPRHASVHLRPFHASPDPQLRVGIALPAARDSQQPEEWTEIDLAVHTVRREVVQAREAERIEADGIQAFYLDVAIAERRLQRPLRVDEETRPQRLERDLDLRGLGTTRRH